ncbi:hypothetical protein [Pelagerythrobacter aerophilus]|uniref:Uncharacterized protein n=1 Tax=Pelagerythrobacter aerophilus TaxID=2306995 RepID=A0A418NJZ0_9SPHN|nr:hypothetical protein [Pelagerythrobacter aerophilus]RIV79544.1 hypothetical protein D2V04_06120 [Pelagerythrobacter aerophilus]
MSASPSHMPCSIEHKVSHREWDEVRIEAGDFFENLPHMVGDAIKLGLIEHDESIDDLIGCPTLNFENGSVGVDEMWGVRDGRVYTSSFSGGLVEWSAEAACYERLVYGSVRPLGGLVSIEFTLTDELRPLFPKGGAQ